MKEGLLLLKAISAGAKVIAEEIDKVVGETGVEEVETPPKKAAKKTRARKKPEPEPELEEEFESEESDLDNDLGFDDEEAEGDEITLEEVTEAFKAFVKKFPDAKTGRMNAKKVLTKFKAKGIDSLKPENYEAVIAILSKKK